MPRLPDVDEKAPEVAAVFAEIAGSRGWVSNALRSMAHAPEGLRRFASVGDYARYHTQLPDRTREVVILATARGSAYAVGHHTPLGLQAGLTRDEVDALVAGRVPASFKPKEAAAVRYVFEFTRGAVSDATFAALREVMSPREITDVTLISAFYLALGTIIAALDVLPEPAEQLRVEADWQRAKIQGGRK